MEYMAKYELYFDGDEDRAKSIKTVEEFTVFLKECADGAEEEAMKTLEWASHDPKIEALFTPEEIRDLSDYATHYYAASVLYRVVGAEFANKYQILVNTDYSSHFGGIREMGEDYNEKDWEGEF